MRRFTRLTNGFSKKVENLSHAVSLHYMHYNFGRVHQSLTTEGIKRTPAMAAGVAEYPWSTTQIVHCSTESLWHPSGRAPRAQVRCHRSRRRRAWWRPSALCSGDSPDFESCSSVLLPESSSGQCRIGHILAAGFAGLTAVGVFAITFGIVLTVIWLWQRRRPASMIHDSN